MSVDRLAALELRLAVLERRRRSSLVLAAAGIVALALASQMGGAQAQSTAAIRAPFRVVNAAGQDIFTVTQAGTETKVAIIDRATVMSTWSASTEGSVFAIGDKTRGLVRLGVDFNGADTGPTLLLADTSRDLLSVEKDLVEIGRPLSVIPKDTQTLRVDPDLVTVTNSMTVKGLKGGNRTSLSTTKLTIHGGDGVTEAASLGLDDAQRGLLRVGTPGGLRAAIGFSKSGNGMSLGFFNKPGVDDLVSLFASAQGSYLELNTTKFHTILNAFDTGAAISIGDAKDTALVHLASKDGAGHMSIANAEGSMAVEIKANSNGQGVVRAGPNFPESGAGVPSAILGRR